MLILVAFITPLIEFFDSWDPPGIGSDTEQTVFALIHATPASPPNGLPTN
jgi:hypothetical protein